MSNSPLRTIHQNPKELRMSNNASGGSSPFLETPLSPSSANNVESRIPRFNVNGNVAIGEEKEHQILSLQYKLNTIQNEFEIERLQMQRQLNSVDKKYRTTIDELEHALNDTKFLHETNSSLNEELDSLRKDYEELRASRETDFKDLKRQLEDKTQEVDDLKLNYENEISVINSELQNARIASENDKAMLKRYEEQVSSQSLEIRNLNSVILEKDAEISNLKTSGMMNFQQNDTTEELTAINRLFQDQVKFTKQLEEANIKQANELKKLRNVNESYNFYKIENDKLQNRINTFEKLEKNYQDSQLKIVNLESKLAAWDIVDTDQESHMDLDMNNIQNPVDVIRNWKLLKKENLMLIDENSKLTLSSNNLKILNDELAMERNQLLDLNNNYEQNLINMKKLNHELEQQKLLSFEECKLLRKQLDEFDNFVNEAQGEKSKDGNNENYKDLVDEYKNKTEDLTNELKRINEEQRQQNQQQSQTNKKRKTNDSSSLTYYSQRINELQLENSSLVRDVAKKETVITHLEAKLKQLAELKEKKIRILQLRDGPLLKDQFIKRKELELLKAENNDLLSRSGADMIPKSVYETLNFELKKQEDEIFKSTKKFMRLKEIFNKKSLEFIDVVNSLLGFKLEFQQDNKVKIYSCFKPSNYLMVDLVKNTLVSNLNREDVIADWDELLKVWIEDRGQIPCFLATITLRLWEISDMNK